MSVLEQTTCELAVRALSQQEQGLVELRARTGTLLTAASLIASFLGAQAIARSGLSEWVVLALSAFCLSVALSIYLLLPRRRVSFVLDVRDIYEALVGVRHDSAAVHRSLAFGIQELRASNEPIVESASRLFVVSGISLLLQIGFLVVAIAVS